MSIEFDALVENGKIVIPKEQKKRLGRRKRVHVTIREAQGPRKDHKPNLLDYLLKHPLHVPGFKPLTREEIYEGR
jgi:hypothetical protein